MKSPLWIPSPLAPLWIPSPLAPLWIPSPLAPLWIPSPLAPLWIPSPLVLILYSQFPFQILPLHKTHIRNNSQFRDELQEGVPGPHVLCAFIDGSPDSGNVLVRVQPDLHPIVQEGKQWGQGERCDKYGDEAILNDKLKVFWEQSKLVLRREIIVLLPACVDSRGLVLPTPPVPQTLDHVLYNRQSQLHTVVEDLFPEENDDQLYGQLQEAPVGRALIQPHCADVVEVARVTNKAEDGDGIL